MLATLTTYAASDVRGVGAVLEVMPSGRSQCGLKRRRPLFVCLGEPPDLVRRQAKITQYLPERPAAADRVQQLLPCIDGQTCLRSRSPARPGGVILRSPALVAVAAFSPPDQCAVDGLGSAAATLRIGLVADLL